MGFLLWGTSAAMVIRYSAGLMLSLKTVSSFSKLMGVDGVIIKFGSLKGPFLWAIQSVEKNKKGIRSINIFFCLRSISIQKRLPLFQVL
jgi:hypothetical protein